MELITAYRTTDGKIFTDEEKAIDHQEGLTASAYLDLINLTIPERERNNLTANDWFRVQCHVVEGVVRKELKQALINLLETLEYEQI